MVGVLAAVATGIAPRAAWAGANPNPPPQTGQGPNEATIWLQQHPGQPLPTVGPGRDCVSCPQPCKVRPNDRDCTGADPLREGCTADGSINERAWAGWNGPSGNLWIYNLWSHNCLSNWARNYFDGGYNIDLYALASHNNQTCTCEPWDAVSYAIWTDMIYGGPGTACVQASGGQNHSWTGATRCY
jgi:hypothetical protein